MTTERNSPPTRSWPLQRGYFQQLPQWSTAVPAGIGVHTAELIRFEELRGARVLIVGGRQSAYEWAALLGDHGAERVDIVHRHDVPRFERVSWRFVNAYVDATLGVPGWWRSLTQTEQDAIARQFWEVGRLTLEWWLTPRLAGDRFHRWPGTHVVKITADHDNTATVTLSNLQQLTVDRIIFATGYRTDISQVPYLDDVISQIGAADGAPVLDTAFQSTLAGLGSRASPPPAPLGRSSGSPKPAPPPQPSSSTTCSGAPRPSTIPQRARLPAPAAGSPQDFTKERLLAGS